MIQDDYDATQSVVAAVIGWELTKEAVLDNGLQHPLEEATTIWNGDDKPRTLALNSSFNLVYSNWNISAVSANRSHASTPEVPAPDLYLPKASRSSSQIFTPLYKKDYNFGFKDAYTYKPAGGSNPRTSTKAAEKENQPLVLSPQTIYVPPGSRFFVIKSDNEEDVRASFLNKVWSSTELGNRRLTKAYKRRVANERIFLFFSVNASGKFCGVAEMLSQLIDTEVDVFNSSHNNGSGLWLEKSKYRGHFKVQWISVKDVYNNNFRGLRVPQNEWRPVTNSRDTQELPFDVGCEMLNVFKKVRSNTSFLSN